MSEQPPPRVRVTGPPRRHPVVRPTRTGEIDAGTAIGAVYMASLLREQRRLAARVLLTIALTIGMVPLAFHLLPSLNKVTVLGLPLGWAVLTVGVHPLLLAVGWAYVRSAEANERDFADLLGDARVDEP